MFQLVFHGDGRTGRGRTRGQGRECEDLSSGSAIGCNNLHTCAANSTAIPPYAVFVGEGRAATPGPPVSQTNTASGGMSDGSHASDSDVHAVEDGVGVEWPTRWIPKTSGRTQDGTRGWKMGRAGEGLNGPSGIGPRQHFCFFSSLF
jgi:hypothetical protein